MSNFRGSLPYSNMFPSSCLPLFFLSPAHRICVLIKVDPIWEIVLLYLFLPLSHLWTVPLHTLWIQPMYFSFTLKENLSMILVFALDTILLLFLYWHISSISSRICISLVLKLWNTLCPFAWKVILPPCLISVSTPGFYSSSWPQTWTLTISESSAWLLGSLSCYELSIAFLDNVCANDHKIYFLNLVLKPEFQLCCFKFLLNIPTQLFHFLPSNEHLTTWAHPSSIHTGLSIQNSFSPSITPTYPHLGRIKSSIIIGVPYLSLHRVISHYDLQRLFFGKTLAAMPFSFSYSYANPWFLLADGNTKLIEKCGMASSSPHVFLSWWTYKWVSLWKIFSALSYF